MPQHNTGWIPTICKDRCGNARCLDLHCENAPSPFEFDKHIKAEVGDTVKFPTANRGDVIGKIIGVRHHLKEMKRRFGIDVIRYTIKLPAGNIYVIDNDIIAIISRGCSSLDSWLPEQE